MRGALGERDGVETASATASCGDSEERRRVGRGGQQGGPVGHQAGSHGGEDQGARGQPEKDKSAPGRSEEVHGGLHRSRPVARADDSGDSLASEARAGSFGSAGCGERRSPDADSASDGGHAAGGESRDGDAASGVRKERNFCECGKPLSGKAGEYSRGILRLSHLRADAVGSGQRTRSEGRRDAGAGQGQSSTGGDGAQTRLPLRTDKTVSWAPILEQAFDERALVDGAGGGGGHHRHLRLGLGLRRGGDGTRRDHQVREARVPSDSGSSSGESVYFSASDDDNDGDDDGGGDDDDGGDTGGGIDQGDHARRQAQDGPVSSCTRSRHGVTGGLVALVDARVDSGRVDGVEQRNDGGGRGELHSRQVRQDGDYVEREGLPQRGVASGHQPVRPFVSPDGRATGVADGAFGVAEDDVSHYFVGSEEGVCYRRGLAALVQRHATDWRHTQRVRQEGEAAAAYRRSLGDRLWGYPVERDQQLGHGYYGDGRYRAASGGHGAAAQLHGGFRGQDSDEVRQGVPHPVRDYGAGVAHRQLRRGHLEAGQWAPSDAAAAQRRGPPPHLDEVDEGAAPRAALRGGSAVGAACFLPP